MAGRVTLVKSVITSIPSYTMQTTRIPKATIDEIEKLCKSFIWGHPTDRRGFHLVLWDTITQPIGRGGLGIRRLLELNEAFLAKICSGLVSDRDKLWVQVLRNKYDDPCVLILRFQSRPTASWLWNSLCHIWPQVSEGMEHTKFW